MSVRILFRAACLALALAQPAPGQDAAVPPPAPAEPTVEIAPSADDGRIDDRLTEILSATGWYTGIAVEVRDSVVFLDGRTGTQDRQDWARALALRTDGVAAVVNRIEVVPVVDWSLAPTIAELRRLANAVVASGPLILVSLLILPLAWLAARATAALVRWLLAGRIETDFLRSVIARTVAIPVFLSGLYVILQIAGLTQLAFSIIGGAGVLGIVIGFAFRDVAENFLASLLLSLRQPFARGDLVVVAGKRGFVHSMSTRATVLVSEDGNHIQIPNAEVFKNIIENLTAAPSQRAHFDVGVGYDASIAEVQDVLRDVMASHPAVSDSPEPMALIDSLGAATVNMRGYFWFDARAYSPLKLRSMLLRRTKARLTERGISMPDEAREVVFPEGVPVLQAAGKTAPAPPAAHPEAETSVAERDLSTEAAAVGEQMVTDIDPGGSDLLDGAGAPRERGRDTAEIR